MTIIKARLNDQALSLLASPVVASGGVGEDSVTFVFDDAWTGYTKKAVFYRDESTVYHVDIGSDNTAVIPWEILQYSGFMYFGVFGTKGDEIKTSTVIRYRVELGAITSAKQLDPTPDIFAEQLAEAVKAYFDGKPPFFVLPAGGELGQALLSDGDGGAYWGDVQSDVEAITWHQCPQLVRDYLANVDYDGIAYTESSIGTYAPTPAVPATNTKPIGMAIDGVTFYNEIPGKKTPFSTENVSGVLTPLDQVRWINSATVNTRDLGGWACDGGKVKYGLLYRSGELKPADEDLFVNQLGIKVECDLTADGTPAYSGKMTFIGHTSYAMYSLANTEAWQVNLRGIFDAVTSGNPVIFHCSMGADRTGTLACILEGLLGVSQSDLDKDYELTSFFALRARNGNYQGGTSDWAHLMAQIEALDGDTIRDKVVSFVIGLGFTVAEINAFRHAMIEGNPADIEEPVSAHTIANTLVHCKTSNAATSVEDGDAYTATITANSGYTLDGAIVQITMGGIEITSSVYSEGTISIPSVTDNVVIAITAAEAEKVNLFDPNDADVLLRGRLNSAGTAVAYADNQLVTGYVTASVGDVFRIETDKALTTNGYTGMVDLYDSGKVHIAQNGNANTQVWSFSNSDMTGVCTIPTSRTGTAYVRFCIAYTDISNIKIYKQ